MRSHLGTQWHHLRVIRLYDHPPRSASLFIGPDSLYSGTQQQLNCCVPTARSGHFKWSKSYLLRLTQDKRQDSHCMRRCTYIGWAKRALSWIWLDACLHA